MTVEKGRGELEPQISKDVAIIIERRKSSHPWAEFVWKGVGIIADQQGTSSWSTVYQDEDVSRFHFGPVPLELHRRMGEAYDANLQTGEPAIWMMLDDADSELVPFKVRGVTIDPYEALGFQDSAEGLVERIPMPADLLEWVIAYLAQMPEPEAFKKRRREGPRLEEQKFGKVPIFEEGGRSEPVKPATAGNKP